MVIVTQNLIEGLIAENNIPLKSTQPKLCIPIISRIYNKMMLGIKFDAIKIYDNLVCDGHHRYLASLLAGYNLATVRYIKTSATRVFEWADVLFDHEDWDTIAKIKVLNEQDAVFNDITFDELVALMNNGNKNSGV